MSAADDRAAAGRWRVRPATGADLAGLPMLGCADRAEPAPAPAGEAWVALHDGPGEPRPMASVALRRRIGYPVPRAWFRLGWAVHASAELGLYRRQRTLMLGHDLCGADELGGWALAPELPAAAAGAAWAALVAAALQARRVTEGAEPSGETAARPCIAALPGWRDAGGDSPVWQGLGRHFVPPGVDVDAGRADALAPLLPRQLVYAALLPDETREALGRCDTAAEPLREALLAAGFGWREHVEIVDGGPVLECWPQGR
jgi:arginine N-succinyltransferase